MNLQEKNELIRQVIDLLQQLIPVEKDIPAITMSKLITPQMLTIKECTELVSGLTEHTVRTLVKQNKVKSIRCSQGERGKILVSRDSLLEYLGEVCA